MTEGGHNLRQRIEEQTIQSLQNFYGGSLGRLKRQLRDDRSQLEGLVEQLPEGEAQVLAQRMIASYSWIEALLDRMARDFGVEDVVKGVGQATQGLQETAEGVLDQAGHIIEGAQGAVGRAVDHIGHRLPRTSLAASS